VLDARDPRIIADGVVQAVARLDGALLDPSIRRVWPSEPVTGGLTAPGPGLGFLRYLSRDPTVAQEMKTGLGYWFMLDPAVTAPNAAIGVHLGGSQPGPRSSWHFMQPGDVLYQPGGFDRAWIFNADLLDGSAGGLPPAESRPVGYCGFLVGRHRNLRPPTRSGPLPFARLCGVARLVTARLFVPCGRLSRVAIELLPLSAAGIVVGSNWTAVIRVSPQYRMPTDTTAIGLDGETWDTPTAATVIAGSQELLYIGGVGMASVELPVDGMLALAIDATAPTTWTGVAVTDLHAQVEGIP
jgi:hypothetical protein